jgi:hypothetical protein
MIYKVLIAIDWENINTGNKTDWKFMEKYPQKSLSIYIFHSDLQKAAFPIFPHIPVTYEPTPKQELLNGSKNSTDRHMIKTILKKVLDENYNEVILVSDDRIFESLKQLLDKIAVKTTIEYSDTQFFKKQPVIERIFEILAECPVTLDELQNKYHKKHTHNLTEDALKQVKCSLKDTLNKLLGMNLICIIESENKYALNNHTDTQQLQEEEIEQNIQAIIQILCNKLSKGHEIDRSTLFNAIKGNTVFSDKFTTKPAKDKVIQKLIEKNVIKPIGDETYTIQ